MDIFSNEEGRMEGDDCLNEISQVYSEVETRARLEDNSVPFVVSHHIV